MKKYNIIIKKQFSQKSWVAFAVPKSYKECWAFVLDHMKRSKGLHIYTPVIS